MTREDLLRLIQKHHCIDVPISVCDPLACPECAEKALAAYENQIYNQALDDALKVVEWDGYTLDIKQRIEQLKRGI